MRRILGLQKASSKDSAMERQRELMKQQAEQEFSEDVNFGSKDFLNMYVMSTNSLTGAPIHQIMKEPWSHHPPLFPDITFSNDKQYLNKLKQTCRKGIPPALRCAIWITNVVHVSRGSAADSLNRTEIDHFGTLGKVEVLDYGWDVVTKTLFPHSSDEENIVLSDFGLDVASIDDFETILISDHCTTRVSNKDSSHSSGLGSTSPSNKPVPTYQGLTTLKKVLYATRQILNFQYCPLLPDLVALLLSTMPPSYAYATIREISTSVEYYLPMSDIEHYSWCKTFGDLMKRMYPQTAKVMTSCGALTVSGLNPLFKRFGIQILPREYVLRIIDVYTLEGYKALFRLFSVILCLSHSFMKSTDLSTLDTFWRAVHRITHSNQFIFDALMRQAYPTSTSRFRRRTFPRRRFITRLLSYNEKWAIEQTSLSTRYSQLDIRALGFVQGDIPVVLAQDSSVRLSLAKFLPFQFKSTNLELIYSSDVHGRSLVTFYQQCARAKHTIVLLEVLQTGGIIGMFATETWHKSSKVYGDGECLLFRLTPNPVCFEWKRMLEVSTHPIGSSEDDSEQTTSLPPEHGEPNEDGENEALFGEFMISKDDFISMGYNKDGSSGLRLNDDFTKGSSCKAVGFNNEPLAGEEFKEFDIGLVEVYHLVREIDGKAVDGEEDIWKGMFD